MSILGVFQTAILIFYTGDLIEMTYFDYGRDQIYMNERNEPDLIVEPSSTH